MNGIPGTEGTAVERASDGDFPGKHGLGASGARAVAFTPLIPSTERKRHPHEEPPDPTHRERTVVGWGAHAAADHETGRRHAEGTMQILCGLR